MFFKIVSKKNIVKDVMHEIGTAQKEIIATMLLSEEIGQPLPKTYHSLLKKKLDEGVMIKRLGFGTREDYNTIKHKYNYQSKQYSFRYRIKLSDYQRLLIIDKKRIFFKVGTIFLESSNRSIVAVFITFFKKQYKKGKII